ncbi:MAG TPA: HNH endonuclease signature motif containing protein [Candidatus Nanoarchaeia archaeon]|nr:HNH endonuclease signature motif containing protein [Candidatus Nanoarchaeia archaeon]
MVKDLFQFNIKNILGSAYQQKKKKIKLTPKERLYVWEHPKLYGRTCHICSQRITKMSELELDHKIPYSQGGKKMNLAHKDCNSMKGSKNLTYIQKKMAFKIEDKRQTKNKSKKKKLKYNNSFGWTMTKPPKFF